MLTRIKVIFLFVLLSFTDSIKSQNASKKLLNVELSSSMLIKGTSSLHDWESQVKKSQTKLTISDSKNIGIETLAVNIDVLSIKSGRKVMDKLTYKALKAEEYPLITFVFTNAKILEENQYQLTIELTGDLTIAGITKNIAVKTITDKLDEDVVLRGSHPLKMTDFGITPPTALLGTIKTGDEIIIDFNLKFE